MCLILWSKNFREELKQRGWGKGLSQGGLGGSCRVTHTTKGSLRHTQGIHMGLSLCGAPEHSADMGATSPPPRHGPAESSSRKQPAPPWLCRNPQRTLGYTPNRRHASQSPQKIPRGQQRKVLAGGQQSREQWQTVHEKTGIHSRHAI